MAHVQTRVVGLEGSKLDISRDQSLFSHGRLYRWTENSFPFFLYLKPVEVTLTSMGAELQSQNRVHVNCEKTTGPIYLKF